MVSVCPSKSKFDEPIVVVTRWMVFVLAVCFWGVAAMVVAVVLAMADSFALRGTVILVLVPIFVASLFRRGILSLEQVLRWGVHHSVGVAISWGAVIIAAIFGFWLLGSHFGLILVGLVTSSLSTFLLYFSTLPKYHMLSDKGPTLNPIPAGLIPPYTNKPVRKAVSIPRERFEPSDYPHLATILRELLLPTFARKSACTWVKSGIRKRKTRDPIFRIAEFRDKKGRRVVVGQARVVFRPQQQVVSVHFPFWPPFDGVPQVRVWHGIKTRIKFDKVYPFGMRLHVRLPSPAPHETNVPVRFCATGNG